jgi:hypothetical protein
VSYIGKVDDAIRQMTSETVSLGETGITTSRPRPWPPDAPARFAQCAAAVISAMKGPSPGQNWKWTKPTSKTTV